MIAAIAVIRDPWAGLGALLTQMMLEAAGGDEEIKAYGKSAIVGLNPK